MTDEQFEQLRDYAERFVRHHYAKRRNPACQEILDDLETFFSDHTPEEVDDWMDITDYVSTFFDEVYDRASIYASDRQRRLLDGYWEQDRMDEYEELKQKIADQHETPLHCAIRSGIDLMFGDFGVLGFTAGDIQALYPEGLPDWVNPRYRDERDGSVARLSELPANTLIAL